DRNRSHWSTSKTPSYTKSVSWQHHPVKQANKDIDVAKLKLTTEIVAIGEIKTETETTRFYVDYDDLMLSLLKEAAKKMINTCNEYQKRHGKKTLFEVPEV
ncbi:hemolysin E, partial [Escherichia coli]|uniref:hemolysin E n=1 Tax=Escherichia coli TaxID=562 RepID=UPI001F58C6B5